MPDNPPISDNKEPAPVTPTPTSGTSMEDILAKIKASAPPIPPAPTTSDFLVKEPEGKPLTVGMENKIEEAKAFNSKLNVPIPPTVEGKTEPGPPTKLERIAEVLRNKGMDSQQQQQALNQIAEILGNIMAMGICSDEDFEKELGKLSVEVPDSKAEVVDINRGRGEGNVETPESLRKIIGEESVLTGRQGALGLARAFGVSDSSASAYANGSTSTSSYKKPEATLKNHVENAKRRVARTARQKLSLALSKITDEKLDDVKARDLAGIAKDMSAVVKNMEPSTTSPDEGRSGPTFVIYAPQMRREESFEVVHVNE